MLGWMVIVSTQTPEERDADRGPDRRFKLAELATWETGVSGTGWLYQLVEKGVAEVYILKGGYPNRYTARAHHVLPLLAGGTPLSSGQDIWVFDEWNDVPRPIPGNQNWNVVTHPDRVAACSSDQILTIEVWDLS